MRVSASDSVNKKPRISSAISQVIEALKDADDPFAVFQGLGDSSTTRTEEDEDDENTTMNNTPANLESYLAQMQSPSHSSDSVSHGSDQSPATERAAHSPPRRGEMDSVIMKFGVSPSNVSASSSPECVPSSSSEPEPTDESLRDLIDQLDRKKVSLPSNDVAERMFQHQRRSLGSNWRYGEMLLDSSATSSTSKEEVSFSLLPPMLGEHPITPLVEKDKLKTSTPPEPVPTRTVIKRLSKDAAAQRRGSQQASQPVADENAPTFGLSSTPADPADARRSSVADSQSHDYVRSPPVTVEAVPADIVKPARPAARAKGKAAATRNSKTAVIKNAPKATRASKRKSAEPVPEPRESERPKELEEQKDPEKAKRLSEKQPAQAPPGVQKPPAGQRLSNGPRAARGKRKAGKNTKKSAGPDNTINPTPEPGSPKLSDAAQLVARSTTPVDVTAMIELTTADAPPASPQPPQPVETTEPGTPASPKPAAAPSDEEPSSGLGTGQDFHRLRQLARSLQSHDMQKGSPSWVTPRPAADQIAAGPRPPVQPIQVDQPDPPLEEPVPGPVDAVDDYHEDAAEQFEESESAPPSSSDDEFSEPAPGVPSPALPPAPPAPPTLAITGSETTALAVVPKGSRALVASKKPARESALAVRPVKPVHSPLDIAEGPLRRISICEVSDDEQAGSVLSQQLSLNAQGKLVRLKSRRIRVPTLKWWAGEKIEYRSEDGSLANHRATAVYKKEEPVTARRGPAKKAAALADRARVAALEDVVADAAVAAIAAEKLRIPGLQMSREQWGGKTVKGVPPEGTSYRKRAVISRLNDIREWQLVKQGESCYSVTLLHQTLRNSTVAFHLAPLESRSRDESKGTELVVTVLEGERVLLTVEAAVAAASAAAASAAAAASGAAARRELVLAAGDRAVIPPFHTFLVSNKSQHTPAKLLTYVVAVNDLIFQPYL